ncbi:MAG: DUF5721 family protein [Lachnospiraceae bacterium]
MLAIQILDIKTFMQFLFQTRELDAYELVSGELQTQMNYTFDGRINLNFFSEEEIVQYQLKQAAYLPWLLAKEKIFQLIKGKKTPTQMKLVLRLSQSQMEDFLKQSNTYTTNDIDGMFVNIIFQEQKLNVIFGISYKIFTLDKSLEEDFSSIFITFLKQKQITFQQA